MFWFWQFKHLSGTVSSPKCSQSGRDVFHLGCAMSIFWMANGCLGDLPAQGCCRYCTVKTMTSRNCHDKLLILVSRNRDLNIISFTRHCFLLETAIGCSNRKFYNTFLSEMIINSCQGLQEIDLFLN